MCFKFSVSAAITKAARIASIVISGLALCIPVAASAADGLIFCSEAGLNALNPQRSPISNMTSTLSYAIYDRLLSMDPETKSIAPGIGALAYTENNGLTRIYRIRKGIKFQSNSIFTPTRTLNAEDVAFSFNRMLDPESPFFRRKQFFPYLTGRESSDYLEKVETRGKDLVVFKLRKPVPNFDNFLAHDNSVILSREYADAILEQNLPPETIDYRPIGSGPFLMQSFLRDSYVRLAPFKDYYGHKPNIDILVLRHSTHINKRFSQLFTGECQVMSNPSPSQISLILGHHREINIEKRSSLFGTFMLFNTRKNNLNQAQKRRALASLISLGDLNKSVYFGYGEFQAPRSVQVRSFKNDPDTALSGEESLGSDSNDKKSANSETGANAITKTKTLKAQTTPLTQGGLSSDTTKNASNTATIPNGIAGLTSLSKDNPQNGEDAALGDIINPYYNYTPIFLKQDNPDTPENIEVLNSLKGQQLEIIILERAALGDASLIKTAQFIREALERYGIHVGIKSYGFQSGLSHLISGQYDLALINQFSDNGNIIVPLSGCKGNQRITLNKRSLQQNFTGWCNSEFDLLARENSSTRNPQVLENNTKRIREILSAEMPLLPLIYSFNTFISINKVHNLKQTPFGGLIFNEVELTEEKK